MRAVCVWRPGQCVQCVYGDQVSACSVCMETRSVRAVCVWRPGQCVQCVYGDQVSACSVCMETRSVRAVCVWRPGQWHIAGMSCMSPVCPSSI